MIDHHLFQASQLHHTIHQIILVMMNRPPKKQVRVQLKKKKTKRKSKNKLNVKKASCHQYLITIKKDGKLYDKYTIIGSDGIQCKAQYAQHGSTSRMNEHLKKTMV
jgi:hypothetical protein